MSPELELLLEEARELSSGRIISPLMVGFVHSITIQDYKEYVVRVRDFSQRLIKELEEIVPRQ